jgi:hypothetical protein
MSVLSPITAAETNEKVSLKSDFLCVFPEKKKTKELKISKYFGK